MSLQLGLVRFPSDFPCFPFITHGPVFKRVSFNYTSQLQKRIQELGMDCGKECDRCPASRWQGWNIKGLGGGLFHLGEKMTRWQKQDIRRLFPLDPQEQHVLSPSERQADINKRQGDIILSTHYDPVDVPSENLYANRFGGSMKALQTRGFNTHICCRHSRGVYLA